MSRFVNFIKEHHHLLPYAAAGTALPATTYALLRARKLSNIVDDYDKSTVGDVNSETNPVSSPLPPVMPEYHPQFPTEDAVYYPQNTFENAQMTQNYPQFYPKSLS